MKRLFTVLSFRLQLVLIFMAALIGSGRLDAQSADDTRTQYPRLLANSYASLSIGAVDYLFTSHQLQPGFRVGSIDTPHLTARVVLFGHEFNRFVSVQGSYTRPVEYVSYRNVNGAPGTDHHHVRVNFGSVTLKASAPVARRLRLYGEGGLGITSRTGFVIAGVPAVTDAHFSSLVVGGGFDYNLNRRWDLTAGITYSPGKASVDQRRSILSSGGVRYTMRALDAAQVAASRDSGFIFPRQVIQMEVLVRIRLFRKRFRLDEGADFLGREREGGHRRGAAL